MRKRYEYLDCRAIGHSWTSIHVEKKPSFGIAVDLLCSRCSTHRRDILSISGRVISRYYRHPDGYKSSGVSKVEWRESWIKSITSRKVKVR